MGYWTKKMVKISDDTDYYYCIIVINCLLLIIVSYSVNLIINR